MVASMKLKVGVFDSGLGGLTVARRIVKLGCDVVYLGDTARIPYGTKSERFVKKYSYHALSFLFDEDVDLFVIACHTASSVAGEWLKEVFKVPIFTMIDMVNELKFLKGDSPESVLIIGTEATVNSGCYAELLNASGKIVYQKATPVLVSMAEEGVFDNEVLNAVFNYYFRGYIGKVEAILLGCTHFPLYEKQISEYFENSGSPVNVLDPAVGISELFFKKGYLNEEEVTSFGKIRCYFTDSYQNIYSKISNFLQDMSFSLDSVEFISLD